MKVTSAWLIWGLFLVGLAGQQATGQEERKPGLQPSSHSESAELKIPAVWEYSKPLISPERRRDDPSHAQKDPSVVFHDGKWHVFMTVKLKGRSVMEYCSFVDWDHANECETNDSASQRERLLLCAASFLFRAASEVVSDLPGGRSRTE